MSEWIDNEIGEFTNQGEIFQREMEMPPYYEGVNIGIRRVDFFVDDCIMVELKALTQMEDVHLIQAMNYC